ncbi:asparaginase [Streptomyces luteolifulvus]|uniref:Asparaginase n=1 Tax=Streptomyces luteolifulvus TaxID=2615112 RepID=A0A6H9V4K2_9ACTN|nr:asparaginase [Streptomyces luteolifulvus]KAB1150003.1 asparaginase [Streptomyces luteolifulvus]
MNATRTVAVYSLGGTIAMTADPATAGVAPALSARDLLAAVPGLEGHGIELRVHDVRRVPGAWLTFDDLTELGAAIDAALAAGGVDGIVITQGTDTIEETAFALDLRHGHEQPVVVTGAMRNPTMPGPDGPANLHAAVLTAADPRLRGAGVVVVLNDEIHAARHVRKSHTTSPAAFTSPGAGPLGRIAENRVRLTSALPRRPAALAPPRRRDVRVGLYTVGLGDDGELLAAWEGRCDGLVVAAFGVGHVPLRLVEGLERFSARVPVVLSSRIGNGPVLTGTYGYPGSEKDLIGRGLVPAGDLGPYRARLLLHGLLAHGADRELIAATFAGHAY